MSFVMQRDAKTCVLLRHFNKKIYICTVLKSQNEVHVVMYIQSFIKKFKHFFNILFVRKMIMLLEMVNEQSNKQVPENFDYVF